MAEDRISHKISREQLMLVFGLLKHQPWLSDVESAFFDVLDFCEESDQQTLIADLVKRTTSLTETDYSTAIKKIGKTIENTWSLNPKSTWLVSSNSKTYTDSSQEVLNRIKSYPWEDNSWKRSRFLTRYQDVEKSFQNGDSIVIVDDFVGTGSSMIKALRWFKDMFERKKCTGNLYVAIITGCQVGIEAISDYGISIVHSYSIPKAITDFYSGQELVKAVEMMTKLEDKLESISEISIEKVRFGYGRSEAMYYREGGNTPNNVFPIFWWKRTKSKRRTVMNRT